MPIEYSFICRSIRLSAPQSIVIMQKQNQTALFAFSKIGSPFDPTQPYQTQLIYSQLILGGLFVRSYRMLFKNKNLACCTFMKRVEKETQYLFLKFVDSKKCESLKSCLDDLQQAINVVRKLKMLNENAMFSFKVLLCFLNDKVSTEMSNSEFYQCLENCQMLQKMGQKDEYKDTQNIQIFEQDCQDVMGGYELQKIKTIVWNYLDTFGAKYKDNIYHQMAKQNQSKLSITRIINTVNWIVYCQTVDKPFNHLESSNWTCFEAQAKEKCKSDRKEIVLTGSGRILYIPLLFICEKLDLYKKQCERELSEIILESKNYYLQAEIKAYLITDQAHHQGLIYKTESDSLRKFTSKQ